MDSFVRSSVIFFDGTIANNPIDGSFITPVGVVEGSRGLSEAKPPDIVAG